jgi:hypothetical protein
MPSEKGSEGTRKPLTNMFYLQNCQHPLTNWSEGCQYLLRPYYQFVRGMPIPSETVLQFARGGHWPRTTWNKFQEHDQLPWYICKRVASLIYKEATRQPLAIPLKKVKFKVKKQEASDNIKTKRGWPPNYAPSIHTNNSPLPSLETVPLKVHLHKIFDLRFFSSKASSWSPDQNPKLFSNINSKSPRYSNSKVIPRIIRIRGKKLFCRVRPK